jgi:hypothetical protein
MGTTNMKLLRHIKTGEIVSRPKDWDRYVSNALSNNGEIPYVFRKTTALSDIEVIDNFKFHEALKFDRFQQSNNSFSGRFIRENGTTVYVWASNMGEFIKRMSFGELNGCFTFAKQGQSLSIIFAESVDLF